MKFRKNKMELNLTIELDMDTCEFEQRLVIFLQQNNAYYRGTMTVVKELNTNDDVNRNKFPKEK